jgi:AmmeMemoRadiSam system protein A
VPSPIRRRDSADSSLQPRNRGAGISGKVGSGRWGWLGGACRVIRPVFGNMVRHTADPDVGESSESPDRGRSPNDEEREILRRVALDSIRHGLEKGRALDPQLKGIPEALGAPGAVFVTLELNGRLRGCVGSFEPRRPLIQDVARNAYAAAFMDFRFSPLSEAELPGLDLHISLLTPLEPLEVKNREGLLAMLRPGVDGLLLEDPPHRATFLPQVWDSLRNPEEFLEELLLKAGLRRDHWSQNLSFHRYGVEEF